MKKEKEAMSCKAAKEPKGMKLSKEKKVMTAHAMDKKAKKK